MLVNLNIIEAAAEYNSQPQLSAERRAYINRLVESYKDACLMSEKNKENQRPAVVACRNRWENLAEHWRDLLCTTIRYQECTRPCVAEACCG